MVGRPAQRGESRPAGRSSVPMLATRLKLPRQVLRFGKAVASAIARLFLRKLLAVCSEMSLCDATAIPLFAVHVGSTD